MNLQSKAKSRKDKILDAALRIFAEKGFQETTITEISKKAGVSEATVYEHFGTKEDLLFAIPEKVTTESIESMEKILPYIRGAEARVRAVMYCYIKVYQDNPDYSALVLIQLAPNKRFRQTDAHKAIRKAAHMLQECIMEGVEDGTFKKSTNPILIRSMLLGTIEHLFVRKHMEGTPADESIEEILDPFMDIVLSGIRADREEQGITLKLSIKDIDSLRDFITVKNQEPSKDGCCQNQQL